MSERAGPHMQQQHICARTPSRRYARHSRGPHTRRLTRTRTHMISHCLARALVAHANDATQSIAISGACGSQMVYRKRVNRVGCTYCIVAGAHVVCHMTAICEAFNSIVSEPSDMIKLVWNTGVRWTEAGKLINCRSRSGRSCVLECEMLSVNSITRNDYFWNRYTAIAMIATVTARTSIQAWGVEDVWPGAVLVENNTELSVCPERISFIRDAPELTTKPSWPSIRSCLQRLDHILYGFY